MAQPASTASLKGGRKIDLSFLSETSLSEASRAPWVSPYAIKCLAQASILSGWERSSPWYPLIMAAASLPARYGSSPKVSSTRPHLISLARQITGEKVQCNPVTLTSLAVIFPTFSTSWGFQLEERAS